MGKSQQKTHTVASQHCVYCGEAYKKQDFTCCPYCGGDAGGVTPKVWKPNKHQRKAYIKKIKNDN